MESKFTLLSKTVQGALVFATPAILNWIGVEMTEASSAMLSDAVTALIQSIGLSWGLYGLRTAKTDLTLKP